jgi:hypothetical protein
MTDVIKLGLLVGFMLFLVWLGKRTTPPPPDPNLLTPEPQPMEPSVAAEAMLPDSLIYDTANLQERPIPATGMDIPFPFDMEELEAEFGKDFERPQIINYFFRNIDLKKGPSDPRVFHDQLVIETWSEEHHRGFVSHFDIATPAGLAKTLEDDKEEFLYGEGIIIVPKYDLRNILRAVVLRFCEPEDPLLKKPESKEIES